MGAGSSIQKFWGLRLSPTALYTNTVMDVGDQCGVRGGACLFLVQYWPEFTLSRFEPNGTWSFLLARFNLKIWGSCSKSMLCKVPNFLEKFTFEHKTNQLTSFPAMDLGTRKLPGSGEAPRFSGSLGSPRIIFDSNCELQEVWGSFLRKLNLGRRWKVCSLAWEAALKILNHGKRVNSKISVTETL